MGLAAGARLPRGVATREADRATAAGPRHTGKPDWQAPTFVRGTCWKVLPKPSPAGDQSPAPGRDRHLRGSTGRHKRTFVTCTTVSTNMGRASSRPGAPERREGTVAVWTSLPCACTHSHTLAHTHAQSCSQSCVIPGSSKGLL